MRYLGLLVAAMVVALFVRGHLTLGDVLAVTHGAPGQHQPSSRLGPVAALLGAGAAE
jgi:hypothetical protein